MIERLIIATALVGGFAAAVGLARLALRLRDRRILERLRTSAAAEGAPASAAAQSARTSGAPRILYFTTTSCVVCRLQQEPAIERLREALPEIVIEQHDAVAERELADQFGILSVPTTAVYDRSGELVTINRGFAPVAQLYAQATGSEHVAEGGLAMASERIDRPAS
ncbi:MAG: thioredoxin family protein [Chloroflexi bacterium]|nr:thioredoxin family protein [Chloroflexota bacterium]MDA1148033.1 thioredoxin family protein [Chloroflexota bacterium]